MPAPVRRPPPPEQLRAALTVLRAEGLPFGEAWALALRAVVWPHDTVHRRQWREALAETRGEWEACYGRVETPVARFFRDFPPELLAREEHAVHDLPRAA